MEHISVLAKEVLEYLQPRPGGIYVDGTVGLGGHSFSILQHAGGSAKIIGVDLDQQALQIASEKLQKFAGSFEFFQKNFRAIGEILKVKGIGTVDGILLDLGVSSLQLESAERGFSFKSDGPLDMRMGQELSTTAENILARLGERELVKIFREYGQERFARKIARAITRHKENRGRLKKTRELADIISDLSIPKFKIHPATRVFQALRISVNKELDNLSEFMNSFDQYLREGGRLVVISYHSLEDRIVKLALREKKKLGIVQILTKKPVRPAQNEIRSNPKSRSACLRAAYKISG